MAWETPGAVSGDVGTSQILAQEGANAFMARVYRWMFGGVALTAITAFAVATTPGVFELVLPLTWPIVIGNFILVVVFRFIAEKVTAPVAAAMFLVYAFGTGLWMSMIFFIFSLGSIYSAFAIAALTFGAMSAYATYTKKDLTGWTSFLVMGMIGILIAMVVSLFFASSQLDWVINCACVVLFAGLTAYHTQMLRTQYANAGYASSGALAIHGALMLYLNFINLFIRILLILGRRR